MPHLQTGAFLQLNLANTALGNYGLQSGIPESLEQGFADGLGEFVTQHPLLQAKGSSHPAAGAPQLPRARLSELQVRRAKPGSRWREQRCQGLGGRSQAS